MAKRINLRGKIMLNGISALSIVYLLLFIIDQKRWVDFIDAIFLPFFNILTHEKAPAFNFFASYNLYIYLWALSVVLWVIGLIIFYKWKDEKSYKEFGKLVSREECLKNLKKMNPKEFENYIAFLYCSIGYSTKVVGRRGDGGVDVEATDEKGIKHYIQCKRYKNKVGVPAIRNFYGAMAAKLVKGDCFIVTTGSFTWDAKDFVKDKPIELVDGFELYKIIRRVEEKNKK